MTWLRFFAIALLLSPAGLSAAPKKPKLPPLEPMIDRAMAAVADGSVVPSRDLAPLLERLAATTDDSERRSIFFAIERTGRHDSANPAAVKAYWRESAPPVLLAIARGEGDGTVRGNALLMLRTLNVADSVLDEAIAIAAADTSPDQRSIQFHGRLLANWRDSQRPAAPEALPAAGAGAKEQAALEVLRRHKVGASRQSLVGAALHAEAEVVAALLDAGIDPNASGITGPPLIEALFCEGSDASAADRLATVEALIEHGADVNYRDAGGHSILMGSVTCPPSVVERLIAAGARVNDADERDFTALHNALMRGKWAVAGLLVDQGARITQQSVDKLFFELPTEPEKLAILARATGKK